MPRRQENLNIKFLANFAAWRDDSRIPFSAHKGGLESIDQVRLH